MYIMNPISDTESEPDQNAPIVESLEKTKPKRKGVAPTTPVAEEPPPKQKRQPTERQLEALAKAREKRALERKAKSENQPVEPKKEVKIETPEPEPQPLEKVEPKEVVGGRNPPPVVEKKKRTYNKKAPAPKAEVVKIDFV